MMFKPLTRSLNTERNRERQRKRGSKKKECRSYNFRDLVVKMAESFPMNSGDGNTKNSKYQVIH